MTDLTSYRRKLSKATARFEDATIRMSQTVVTLNTATKNLKAVEEAQAFFQQVAKSTQEKIKFHIEDIVNMALTALFPMYKFELRFQEARGRTEALLLLIDKDGNEYSPLDDNGGGVSAVVSFALRMALLVISKNRRTLILDQPFSDISNDGLKDQMYEVLQTLVKEIGVQCIIVSHDNMLNQIADREFKIVKKKDKSVLQEVV